MRIREYTSGDFDALRRLHAAQGFGYPLPDLDSPLFVTKLVLEDDADDWNPNEDCADHAVDANDVDDANGVSDAQEAGHVNGAGMRNKNGNAGGREVAPRGNSLPLAGGAGARPQGIAMAVLLRLTAEAYLLHDPAAGTPRLRWQQFLALHEVARNTAAARGLDDVQAFLPPLVARAFGRRLGRLGWTRDPWDCFSQRV